MTREAVDLSLIPVLVLGIPRVSRCRVIFTCAAMSRLLHVLVLSVVVLGMAGCMTSLSEKNVTEDQWEPPVTDKTP
jgi:hypothetical protein